MRFYFYLAEKLGKTVDHLLNEMSSEELTYWMAYYSILREEEKKQQKEMERKTSQSRRRGRKRR